MEVNTKGIVIRCSDGSSISGKVNIGRARRLSDLLTRKEEPFLVVFDTIMEGRENQVVFVNINHIVWAMPQDQED